MMPQKPPTAAVEIQRIEELFFAALELESPEEQAKLLAGECPEVRREVEALLLEDQRGPVVQRAVRAAAVSLMPDLRAPDAPQPGTRIGAYEIREEIGRGGMGTVYLAVRADEAYQRKVAIKFVRREFDTAVFRERFQRERRILGRLDHPYIARLLDAGSTANGGQPYFVMEYVAGARPITAYAREKGLSRQERVELFAKVCEAVPYAHQNLTVHRDLKPGNILIDEAGTPKLLDFGIAKLTGGDEASTDLTVVAGMRMLTPDYASPEQYEGRPVTTAADVFSLGAVLYELIEECRPPRLETGRDEIDPPAGMGPDLGGILRMAMHRDPARRYPSANDFRDDLLRFAAGQPIRARTYSWVERSAYFAQRYATFLLVSTLVTGGLSGAALFSIRAAQSAEKAREEAVRERNRAETARQEAIANSEESVRQRRQAELERNIARQRSKETVDLTGQLIRDLQDKIEGLPGAGPARLESITVAIQYLERLSHDRDAGPDARRDLALAYMRLGDLRGSPAVSNLGDRRAALDLFVKSEKILREPVLFGRVDTRAVLAKVLARQVELRDLIGDFEGSKRALREGLAIGREVATAGRPESGVPLAAVLTVGGHKAIRELDYDLALEYSQECLAVTGRAAKSSNWALDQTADCVLIEGRVYGARGNYQKAVEVLRRGIAMREELLRQQPSNNGARRALMFAYSHLSAFLGSPSRPSMGDLPGALAAMEKVREHAVFNARSDPMDVSAQRDLGISSSRFGDLLFAAKQYQRAAQQFTEACDVLSEMVRTSPADRQFLSELVFAAKRLGDVYSDWVGHATEAHAAYRMALIHSVEMEKDRANMSVSSVVTALQLHVRFAQVLGQGSAADAVAHMDRAVELMRDAIGGATGKARESLQSRERWLLREAAALYEQLGYTDRVAALQARLTPGR